MKNWLTSLNGTITLSVIALLTFLGRAFMDWRYEYPQQDPTGSLDTMMALIYMALIGGWLWGLLAANRGSRPGLIICLIAVLLLDVALALVTYFFLCPPWTGCQGWPNAWPWNWSNLISGLIAAVALAFQIRQKKDSRLTSISNWPPAKSGNRVMIDPNPAPPRALHSFYK